MSPKKSARKPKQGKGNDKAKKKSKSKNSDANIVLIILKFMVTGLILCPIIAISLLFVIPSEIEPVEVVGLPPPPAHVGPSSPNEILTFSKQLFKDEIGGPESFVIDGEHIYTGTEDGWITDLHKGEVHKLVKFWNDPCEKQQNEGSCGRPLGMRLEKKGSLIVVDADHGLFRVDVATGKYEQLYDSATLVNGIPSKYLNDLDIGSDGTIYFSDSSTRWNRHKMFNIHLEGAGTGRLLKYDPKTKVTEELLDNLLFANGVQVTPDHSSVLVSEFGRARIMKYDLKTKRASVWADNLPGMPDNIRYSKQTKTYWIGLGLLRSDDKFSLTDFLAPKPWLRGLLGKVTSLAKRFGLLTIKNMKRMKIPGFVAEFDESGNIVRSLRDSSGAVIGIVSEVQLSDGFIYIGSPMSNYLGKLPQKEILPK